MPAIERMSDDLPAPFAPDERDQLAGGHLERHARERLRVAVVEIEIANRQHQDPGPSRASSPEVAIQHRRIAHDRAGSPRAITSPW